VALQLVGAKEETSNGLMHNGNLHVQKSMLLPDPPSPGSATGLAIGSGLHHPDWRQTAKHVSNIAYIQSIVTAVKLIPVSDDFTALQCLVCTEMKMVDCGGL